MPSSLLTNIASLVQVARHGELQKASGGMHELPTISNAFLAVEDGLITDLGPMKQAPQASHFDAVTDCTGRLVFPGFVDAHTHVVYAGNRAEEFEQRAAGKTYQEIAAAGGGIKNSLAAVRRASKEQLISESLPRLQEMLCHGTTTVEIKSGYGLTLDDELKMLRAIKALQKETPVTILATFLGAHDLPPEYTTKRADYIQLIIQEMLPRVAEEKLAQFCDVFCEEGYFTPAETEKICGAAQDAGLKIRLHANELACSGGVQVAVKVGASSADHLLYVGDTEIALLQKSKTIPILLPGTSFFLKFPYAPARKMIDAGLTVALASDANPGSCTALSLPFIMNLATTQMHMSPAEALCATTLNAAASLELSHLIGSLEKGKKADLIISKPMTHVREISYQVAQNPCWRIYKNGQLVA